MKISEKLITATTILSLLSSVSYAREIQTNTAQMQAMDKVTGRVKVIEVPVNGNVEFGSFSILVRDCQTRPPEETPENYAFVDILDNNSDGSKVNVFRGWMMSSTPSLNAVEHPIYDVWLLKCIDTEINKDRLLSEEDLIARNSYISPLPSKKSSGPTNLLSNIENNIEAEQTSQDNISENIEEPVSEQAIETDIETDDDSVIIDTSSIENMKNFEEDEETIQENISDENAPNDIEKIDNSYKTNDNIIVKGLVPDNFEKELSDIINDDGKSIENFINEKSHEIDNINEDTNLDIIY